MIESVKALWAEFLAQVPLLVAGVLVLVLTWLAARLVRRLLKRLFAHGDYRPSFEDLVRQLATVAVWVIGITVAAVVAFPGLSPASVLAGLGLGSIALGFAFKDIVENFLAGILILWRYPFEQGDFIRWDDVTGQVEDISIRMTQLRQSDGHLVVLPNALIFKEPVTVLTDQARTRFSLICGVGYDEDVDAAREVIRQAVASCPSIDQDLPIQIFAQEFADSSVNFEIACWSGSTPGAMRAARDEVVSAVKRALDDAGIEIPFPYRTLTFKERLEVSNQ